MVGQDKEDSNNLKKNMTVNTALFVENRNHETNGSSASRTNLWTMIIFLWLRCSSSEIQIVVVEFLLLNFQFKVVSEKL